MSQRGGDQSTPKNWVCNVCGKIFESEHILNAHKHLEHGESSEPPAGVS
jgi:hypothetical protein